MSGDALEVALALLRTPSQRSVLRQRPLPSDVGELIEIASGEPSRLARAATSSGATPEHVLEAARFYIREVLLFAGADSYRVLGVGPDAEGAQIKLHHRHLQHWLHPDRRGNEWESAFSMRINAAWSDLRSLERRMAYDERRSLANGPETSGPRRTLISQWRPSTPHGQGRLGWLLAGAGAVLCAWLLVLVERQAAAPAPEWDAVRESQATVQPAPAGALRAHREPILQDQRSVPGAAVMPGSQASAEGYGQSVPYAEPADLPGEPLRPAAPQPVAGGSPHVPELQRLTPGNTAYTEWTVDPERHQAGGLPPRETRSSARLGTAPRVRAVDAEVPAEVEPARLVERAGLLRRRGHELIRYASGEIGPAPPIWHSVSAQDQAVHLRTRLIGRRVRFEEPTWGMTGERATMTAAARRSSALLQLQAHFTWRDGMWLVESVHIEGLQ